MNKHIHVIYFTLLIFFVKNIKAQEPLFKRYSPEDGFPSSMGFSIVQDSDRFIWICTNNGLCRFDGRHVKTFSPQNSPVDYGAFHLYSDSKQRLWVISIFSAPVYYHKGAFHNLDSALKREVAGTRWIVEDSKGAIYFLLQHGIVKWNGTNEFKRTNVIPTQITGAQLINDSILVVTSGMKIYKIENLQKVEELSVKGYEQDYNRFYKIKENLVFGSSAAGLYEYTDKGHQLIWKYKKGSPRTLYCLCKENDSTFWIGSDDGVCVFNYKNSNLRLQKKLLPGKFVLSIIKDNNGNHWISTSEDGVYFLNAVNAVNYNLNETGDHISQILFSGDDGYVFNKRGDYFLLKNNRLVYRYNVVSSNSKSIFINAIKLSDNAVAIAYRGNTTGIITHGKLSVKKSFLDNYNYYYRPDGSFFAKGINEKGAAVVEQIEDNKRRTIGIVPERLIYKTIFCVDLSDRCWIGRKDSVYCIDPMLDAERKSEDILEKSAYISDLQCDRKNMVWVATKGDGVYCYKNRKRIFHYSTDNGLLTNNCSSLYIDYNDDVWICSENGLNLLQYTREKYLVRSYTTDNLLPDDCISSVYDHDGNIYIGTNKGLVSFKKKDMLAATSFPVPCYISNVAIKGRDTAVGDNYMLKYGNSISITFSTIAYNIGKAPTYLYTLHEAQGEWDKTTSEKIQYEHLAPGQYTFKVYAEGSPDYGAALTFTVLPPYWRKWWFLLLEAVAIIILLASGVYGVVYYKNRQSEAKRKMIENDLKSLRAQINPHFIFNALNSIQDFILNHRPRPANYFLSRFSKLIRMIVDNSGRGYISLEDEIEFLTLYLELEQLRLGDSFSFKIDCDADLDITAVGIPPMILQPVVENSLVHGLPMKAGQKELSLYFEKSGQMLKCIISDNGIGRKKASQFEGEKQRVSMGLNNITERLQLVCAKENIKWQPIEITDIGESPSAAGTTVSLFIPLINMN